MKFSHTLCSLGFAALVFFLPVVARSQSDTSTAPRAQSEPKTREPILTKGDAAILGVGVAATAYLFSVDKQISDQFRDPQSQRNPTLRSISDFGNYAGDPGTVVVGAGIWLSGHLTHDRTRELVGRRTLEALAAAATATFVLKMVTGRARPDESPDEPMDFRLGRGFGNRNEFQSFPAGHVSQIFAFASAIDAELNRIAPDHPKWLVPLLYAVATTGGASRFYRDRHWTSDVVFGATIGFVAGRAVVRWRGDSK